jgi:hypothetical protein
MKTGGTFGDKKEKLLEWNRLAGRWVSSFDSRGPRIAPLRAGLHFAEANAEKLKTEN